MLANRLLGIATSASWNVIYRPWRTTLAPILISADQDTFLRRRSIQLAKRESGTSESDSRKCKLALICAATVLGVVGIEVTTQAFLPSPELRAVSPHWTPGLLIPHQTRSYDGPHTNARVALGLF